MLERCSKLIFGIKVVVSGSGDVLRLGVRVSISNPQERGENKVGKAC